MLTSWITLLTFLATSVLTFGVAMLAYDRFFRYRLAVRGRLQDLSHAVETEHSVSLFKDMKHWSAQETLENRTWLEGLQQVIDQSGAQCQVSTLLGWCAGTGFVVAVGGASWVWWLGALLMPVGASIPILLLVQRKRARQRKLIRQLPETFAMISRAVRAGQTVPAALQIIAEDFEPPISAEFALCYEQQNLGMSRESTLRKLATRTGIMELQIFVVALLVQAKSGGDLVELLDNLAALIRKRLKLRDRVRALTGEGRMQAAVLIVLPFAALLGIVVLSPEYAQSLLERPWILACTAAAQAAGAFWIRRIVNFDY